MVDKNINIIYKAFGGEQVQAVNKQIAESMIPIGKQSKTIIEEIRGGMKSTSYDIQTVAVQNRDSMGRFASGFQMVDKQIEKNIRTVEDHRQRFKMYLLSVMFFGMMIQRTFQNMATTTLSTFMKITEAQTAAGQAVTALSAHWEFLKFSVGEAIGAFIAAHPEFLEWIDSIADFVQQNEGLISSVIIAGLAIGAAFMLTGQLGLGLSGIKMMITAIAGGEGLTKALGSGGLVGALGGAGSAFLFLAAMAVIAGATIQYQMKNPQIAKNAQQTSSDIMDFFATAWSFIGHIANAELEKISKEDYPSFVNTTQRFMTDWAVNQVNSIMWFVNEAADLLYALGAIPKKIHFELWSAEEMQRRLGIDKATVTKMEDTMDTAVAATIKAKEKFDLIKIDLMSTMEEKITRSLEGLSEVDKKLAIGLLKFQTEEEGNTRMLSALQNLGYIKPTGLTPIESVMQTATAITPLQPIINVNNQFEIKLDDVRNLVKSVTDSVNSDTSFQKNLEENIINRFRSYGIAVT